VISGERLKGDGIMPLPDAFLQELKARSDLAELASTYVNLKRSGKNLVGLCPFHSEKSPSFTVYPDNGSFYCFGCGVGGDVITFVRRIENLDYMESIRFLAQRAGLTVPENQADDGMAKLRTRILAVNRETARFYYGTLVSEAGAAGRDYFARRSPETGNHPPLRPRLFTARPLCPGGLSGAQRFYPAGNDPCERRVPVAQRQGCRPVLRPRDVSRLSICAATWSPLGEERSATTSRST
jgi:hypothetical protein